MTKATANDHGVRWATSKSGQLRIAVGPQLGGTGKFNVWALYTGSHELAPYTKNGLTLEAANKHANWIWSD